MLVHQDLLGEAVLQDALARQKHVDKPLGALLTELGALREDDLAKALAEQAGLQVIDLGAITPDPDAINRLPESVARSVQAVPIDTDEDGVVQVALADPSQEARERVSEAIDGAVSFVVAPPSDVRRIIDTSYRALERVSDYVSRFEGTDVDRSGPTPTLADTSEDAPIVRILDLLLTQAVRDRASDVHIEPQDVQVRVRFRIDGALHDVQTLPPEMAAALVSRVKIMAGLNIVERRRPHDGSISTVIDDRELDIRVAIAPTIWGEKVVLRLLDKSRPLFRLDELGMNEDDVTGYEELIHSPFGMVVCAGPTGSGKTTTLYATLLELNDAERNITTIEDPVEYVLPTVNQIQINPSAELTFVSGLRSILRQDPDAILVGEVRDGDTAKIAVRAALTGHLVLSSIHATDAASALQRFVEMGVEPYLVSSSVLAVIAQRLVRRICRDCAQPYEPSADERTFFEQVGGGDKREFVRGTGCNFCAQTGYLDRVGVYEVLTVTEEMRKLLVSGASRDQLRELAVSQGMRTLPQQGLRLVEQDVTTIDEIARSIWTV